MPSTVTFIKVAGNTAIPARVFVNRARIVLSAPVAVNEKSLIKLTRINILRLSNNDLNSLIDDIRDEVRDLLIKKPLRDLFALAAKLILDNVGHNWKCRVTVSLNFVANLRFQLHILTSDDYTFLTGEKKLNLAAVIGSQNRGNLGLMQRYIRFQFHEEDSENDAENDTKKLFDHRMHKIRLANNRLGDCLDLYVYSRPQNV